jgi:hypothetical protein
MKYTIVLNDAESKALSFIAKNPQEWLQNMASERARLAIEEIFLSEVSRMISDPEITEIPADREKVVLDAQITLASDVIPPNVL